MKTNKRVFLATILLLVVTGCTSVPAPKPYAVSLVKEDSFFTVPVSIGGTSTTMLLDIGSNTSGLAESAVELVGATKTKGKTTTLLMGGTADFGTAIASLEIGNQYLGKNQFLVLPDRPSFLGLTSSRGILGLNVFAGGVVVVDGPRRELSYKLGVCDDARRQPVLVRGGKTEVTLGVNGVPRAVDLDSGLGFSVLRFSAEVHNALPADGGQLADMSGNLLGELRGPVAVEIELSDGSKMRTMAYSGPVDRLGASFIESVVTLIDLTVFRAGVYSSAQSVCSEPSKADS